MDKGSDSEHDPQAEGLHRKIINLNIRPRTRKTSEHDHLIKKDWVTAPDGKIEDIEIHSERCTWLACVLKPDVRVELAKWYNVAWTTGLTAACEIAMLVTDVSFLGHINTDYLAAASLATVWITIVTITIWSFCDTVRMLCSQAKGAGNSKLVGTWLQIGILWVTLLCFPVGGLLACTGDILRLAHIEEKLCNLAQTFACYSIMWLWPRGMYLAGDAYMQSQNIVYPQLVSALIAVGINVGLNYLFVRGGVFGWHGFGFIGSPIATMCSQSCLTFMIYMYVIVTKKYKPTWPGWTRETFSWYRHKEFLRQAIPITFGHTLEEAQVQVITLFAGKLGSVRVATHSGMFNVFSWLSTSMWGLMQATTVRVGMHLGNGDIKKAKLSSKISFISSLALGTIVAVVFVVAGENLGKIFSSDPLVWHETGRIAWIVGAGYFALSTFFASVSILEGQARPNAVAISFLLGSWGVSVPLAYVLAFEAHLDIRGLWFGMSAGYFVVMIIAGILVLRGNWEKIAKEAMERSEEIGEDDESEMFDDRGRPAVPLVRSRHTSERSTSSTPSTISTPPSPMPMSSPRDDIDSQMHAMNSYRDDLGIDA